MTKAEEKGLAEIRSLLSGIQDSNDRYRKLLTEKVDGLEKRVDEKHLPLKLEDILLGNIEAAMNKALSEALGGYNSPVQQYAKNVVSKYQSQIESIFDSIVQEAITTDEFKLRVREVLISKIAKTMIAGVDGTIDKTINLMKQDAVFRSRLTLSVNGLVEEVLSKQKTS